MRQRVSILALVATLAVGGCASSGVGGSPVGGSGSNGGSDNGSLSASELATQAIQQLRTVPSVEISGQVSSSGEQIGLDVHYGEVGSSGSVTINGTNIKVIEIGGSIFFQAPDAFLTSQGITPDQLAQISGKWIKISSSSATAGQFHQLTDRTTFLGKIASGAPSPDSFTKGPSGDVDGTATVSIIGNDSDRTRVDIAAQGTPYPLKLSSSTAGQDVLTFSHWNEPFTPTVPSADQVFDASGAVH